MPTKRKKPAGKVKSESTLGIAKKRGRPKKTKQPKEEKMEVVAAVPKIEKEIEVKRKPTGYQFAIGRRKSSIARIHYNQAGHGEIIINGKDYHKYFPYFESQKIILSPLILAGYENKGSFNIKVEGGGKRGQAESIRHGLARLIVTLSSESRPLLKKSGVLEKRFQS